MSAAAGDLQKAIYTALTTALTPVVVYDDVPQGAAFPYVSIGEDTSIQWDSMPGGQGGEDGSGEESTLTLHIWSKYNGRKETKTIMRQIYGALHNKALSVENQYLVLLQFEYAESFLDEDQITRHGVVRYRALTSRNT